VKVEVLILLLGLSAGFVAGAIGLFVWSVFNRTYDHADRLALLPLDAENMSSKQSIQYSTGSER